MLNHLLNRRTLHAAVFAVAVGMLTGMVAVPAGAQDKPLSKTELKRLMTGAETKADHARVAEYFEAEATRYEAEAKQHGELALFYQQHTSSSPTKYPGSMQTFDHCDALRKSLEQAAENARQLAAEHRKMEQEAQK
jgi:hypothetical protein